MISRDFDLYGTLIGFSSGPAGGLAKGGWRGVGKGRGGVRGVSLLQKTFYQNHQRSLDDGVLTCRERPFVHNSVCSQFLEGLFAILAECSQFCLRSF